MRGDGGPGIRAEGGAALQFVSPSGPAGEGGGEACAGAFRGGDPEEMFQTLKKIKTELPQSTLLHPGHNYAPQSPTSTMEAQCQGNPFLHFDDSADFVKYRMHVHDKIRDTPYGAVSKEEACEAIK